MDEEIGNKSFTRIQFVLLLKRSLRMHFSRSKLRNQTAQQITRKFEDNNDNQVLTVQQSVNTAADERAIIEITVT